MASALGAALLIVQRRNAGEPQRGDHVLLAVAAGILGLDLINLGGGSGARPYDAARMHGVRLTAEPILLLVLGLLVPQARKAFRWGMISLAVTAVGVALVGLWQQWVGEWGLVDLGYEWDVHVRTVYGRLRSFGSLDDPFAYAAFLPSGIVAVVFFLRRSAVAAGACVLILGGLAFGYVRTSAIVLVALVGLWLARKRHAAAAILVLLASVAAGVVVLLANTEVSESRVVQANSNTYLTINGRTQVWKQTLAEPSDWLFGQGVGAVGTAAERPRSVCPQQRRIGRRRRAGGRNGYLAAIADTGIIGLLLLLVLLARLAQLSVRAIGEGFERLGRRCAAPRAVARRRHTGVVPGVPDGVRDAAPDRARAQRGRGAAARAAGVITGRASPACQRVRRRPVGRRSRAVRRGSRARPRRRRRLGQLAVGVPGRARRSVRSVRRCTPTTGARAPSAACAIAWGSSTRAPCADSMRRSPPRDRTSCIRARSSARRLRSGRCVAGSASRSCTRSTTTTCSARGRPAQTGRIAVPPAPVRVRGPLAATRTVGAPRGCRDRRLAAHPLAARRVLPRARSS